GGLASLARAAAFCWGLREGAVGLAKGPAAGLGCTEAAGGTVGLAAATAISPGAAVGALALAGSASVLLQGRSHIKYGTAKSNATSRKSGRRTPRPPKTERATRRPPLLSVLPAVAELSLATLPWTR